MTRMTRTTLMSLAAAALCAAVVGCGADAGRPASMTRKDPRSMKPAELQQFVSTNAALAGANAGAALTQLPTEPLPPPVPALPPVPVPPAYKAAAAPRTVVVSAAMSVPETTRRVSPPAVKIPNVKSGYYETEEDARYDALGVATVMIAEKLSKLDPPISANVRRSRVWNEFVSPSSAKSVPITDDEREALKDTKVSANSVRYQFDVEISEQQLRNLRGEGRAKHLAPFALAGLALCFGASVLLKLTGAAAAGVRRLV